MIRFVLPVCALSFAHPVLASFDGEVIEILAPKQAAVDGPYQTTLDIEDMFSLDLARTIADAMRRIPGVSLNGQGGQFQSYSIRGFSRSRIRTEVDGIPIVTDRRAGNAISFISPDLVTQVSVIKGPSSTLYGSQALGGVANVTTGSLAGTHFSLAGQIDGGNLSAAFKHKEDSLTYAIALQRGNDESAANGERLNTDYQRMSSLIRYQMHFGNLTTTFSWLPSYAEDIGKSSARFPTREQSDYPSEIHSLAQVHLSSHSGWTAKLFHHYQNWDNRVLRPEQYQALNQYQSHTVGGHWSQQLYLDNTQSVIGIDWLSRTGATVDSNFAVFGDAQDSDAFANQVNGDETNLALYAKTNTQWHAINIDFGVRYDWLEQDSENTSSLNDDYVSFSLSGALKLSPTLSLSASVANGFRFPTLSERFFDGRTPRGFVSGNSRLKPEKSLGSQAALVWQATETLRLNSALFYYQLDDYIQRYDVADNELSYRNVDSAIIKGLELQLYWQATDHVTHQLDYQQQSGEDNNQQTLDDVNPRRINWTLEYEFDKLSVGSVVSHVFSTTRAGPSELQRGSHTLWNGTVSYELSDSQSISFTINNILNQTYYASLDEDAPFQPQRSVRLSTQWTF